MAGWAGTLFAMRHWLLVGLLGVMFCISIVVLWPEP
jgi:hypothetical protein